MLKELTWSGQQKDILMASTDFARILTELQESGVNDYKMAELTGIERTKLSKLRNGKIKQPTYDDGVSIISIYKNMVRNAS